MSTNLYEKFIEFSLGDECYAIPLLSLQEVIPVPETTVIPNSPSYFIGIMNLRGRIISIIDLRKKMNIKSLNDKEKNENKNEEAVIIVGMDEMNVGLIVDKINRVKNFSENDFLAIPEINAQINTQYIQGAYQENEKLVILIDIEKILDKEKILKIKNIA